MNEMVERVAIALYVCPGNSAIASTDMLDPPWDRLDERFQEHWRILARAGIRAMREPTNAMCQAVERHSDIFDASDPWTRMIEEALK